RRPSLKATATCPRPADQHASRARPDAACSDQRLVLAHPRRLTTLRFAIELAHAEFEIVQIGRFREVSVVTLFGGFFRRLRKEQEKAAQQVHGSTPIGLKLRDYP